MGKPEDTGKPADKGKPSDDKPDAETQGGTGDPPACDPEVDEGCENN